MGVDLKNDVHAPSLGETGGLLEEAAPSGPDASSLSTQPQTDSTQGAGVRPSKERLFAPGTSFRFEATGLIGDQSDPAGAMRRLQRFARGLPFNLEEERQPEGSVWVLFVEVDANTGRFAELLTQVELRNLPSVLAALASESGGDAGRFVQAEDLVRRVALFEWALVALYLQKPSFLVAVFPGNRRVNPEAAT